MNVINGTGMTALEKARIVKRAGIVVEIEKAQEQRRGSHRIGEDARSRRPMGESVFAIEEH